MLFHIASNGIGNHLLKAGSKRRRTQAEMKDQLEQDELANVLAHDADDQIKKLKQQLADAEEVATNNKTAADILTQMLARKEVEQLADGSIKVAGKPNVIGNEHEQQYA